MTVLVITRAGPLTTIQDTGRPGYLAHGVSASGPMDRSGFDAAGAAAGVSCGAAIECTGLGVCLRVEGGTVRVGFGGGIFTASRNGVACGWSGTIDAEDGDVIDVRTGPAGNYGYIRFDREIGVPPVLGSRATNATVGLGGLKGRALEAGDHLALVPLDTDTVAANPLGTGHAGDGPIRMVWGLHAERFPAAVRERFLSAPFEVTARMDRMGVRLKDGESVFAQQRILSLVSDAVTAGDIQILGDGTPIVLMRDHQPTGGYPRIGTVIGADLDRFAQMRPGSKVLFQSVTAEHARNALIGWRRS